MKRARLVVLVLAALAIGACRKESAAAAPVVPATAAPEPVPATPPPDAQVAAVPPDAAVAADAAAAPSAAPKPAAPAGDPLVTCASDGDCSLLWLGRGCLPGDPMAVARAHEAEARKKYAKGPPLACGIGGPKYDADRRAILARYAAACRAKKCALVDRGPQPTPPVAP